MGPLAIALCISCHGSVDSAQPYDAVPKLWKQNRQYLINQLNNFKSGERKSKEMEQVSKLLTDEQIKYLADYFSQENLNRPIFNQGDK